MPWIVGTAVGLGALISQDASRSAGNKQADSTSSAMAEQAREFDTARSDTGPYRAAGRSGIIALRDLLGLSQPVGGQASQQYHGSLVDVSGGIPRPIQDLYDTDPNYRNAWDDYERAHVQWAGHGYTENSNPAAIEQEVRARLPATAPQPSTTGSPSSGVLSAPLTAKFSVADFWNDPVVQLSYKSGLDLGTKALKNAAPLTTGLDSGAALKELTKFGTDYTGQQAGASQQRFVNDQGNLFNKLAALSGIGQTAVGQSSAVGTNAANNISNLISSQGNASAAAKIAGANAFSGGLQSIANWWSGQNTLNKILNRPSTTDTMTSNYSPSWNLAE